MSIHRLAAVVETRVHSLVVHSSVVHSSVVHSSVVHHFRASELGFGSDTAESSTQLGVVAAVQH